MGSLMGFELTTTGIAIGKVGDPPAVFATDAELEIADQLRHQLEQRYHARSETLPPLPARPGNGH